MTPWDQIETAINKASSQPFTLRDRRAIGGGCINEAYRIEGAGQRYFVKLNHVDRLDMFKAEHEGLLELAAPGAIRVPLPLCHGVADDQSFLVMEFIALGRGSDGALLGRQLAALHAKTGERFGWRRDNTIGATPQVNAPTESWTEFWRRNRLGYQLHLAARKGHGGTLQRRGEQLMERLPDLFSGHTPAASLLHGDLWGGNRGTDREGNPVIFDPAVYFGDREADLAMTELFGGFGGDFQAAYREAWPLDAGYPVRRTLYNLYHILNHLNLFGGGYGAQAEHMMGELLSELR